MYECIIWKKYRNLKGKGLRIRREMRQIIYVFITVFIRDVSGMFFFSFSFFVFCGVIIVRIFSLFLSSLHFCFVLCVYVWSYVLIFFASFS